MEHILQKLDDGEAILAFTPAVSMKANHIELVKELTKMGHTIVVITINQPAAMLEKLYAKAGINTQGIYFVDAVTKYAGGQGESGDRCYFINKPSNLTDLGIAITDIIQLHRDENLGILFDSVSTMLIHVTQEDTSKFIHFIVNKFRLSDLPSILLATSEGLDPVLSTQLQIFVDDVVEIPAG